tara:strand:- start:49744 stop:50880 length:1137 start_codon:yes stop_codon:yes gene_type:complete
VGEHLKNLIYISIAFLVGGYSQAWETDNISTRVQLLKQSETLVRHNLYLINDQSNEMIEAAINHFNKKNRCEEDSKSNNPKIYAMVKNTMGGGFISGALEDWVEESDSGVKIPSLKGVDIYSVFHWNPEPPMNLAGHVVGTDKLGHFIDQGFELFSKYKLERNDIKDVLKYSESTEETFGMYGLLPAGIKSYGDLAANFKGLHFYLNLLSGKDPHIKCNIKNGRYYLAKPLNWADYIDASLDEGVNCSLFHSMEGPVTPALERMYLKKSSDINSQGKSFRKNLKKLYEEIYSLPENKELKLNNFCPVESRKCDAILGLNCAAYTVSPQCFTSSSSTRSYSCSEILPGYPVRKHKYKSYQYPSGAVKVIKHDGTEALKN